MGAVIRNLKKRPFEIITFLVLASFLVQGVCAELTAFDKCTFRTGGGSYPERQLLLVDYFLKGGPDFIMISPDGISEYSNNYTDSSYSRYWYSTRSDIVIEKANPKINSRGLFFPKGPFNSVGYDYKMLIWVGIDRGESDCSDEIMEIYDIIQNCALEEGYNNTAVVFHRELILLD